MSEPSKVTKMEPAQTTLRRGHRLLTEEELENLTHLTEKGIELCRSYLPPLENQMTLAQLDQAFVLWRHDLSPEKPSVLQAVNYFGVLLGSIFENQFPFEWRVAFDDEDYTLCLLYQGEGIDPEIPNEVTIYPLDMVEKRSGLDLPWIEETYQSLREQLINEYRMPINNFANQSIEVIVTTPVD